MRPLFTSGRDRVRVLVVLMVRITPFATVVVPVPDIVPEFQSVSWLMFTFPAPVNVALSIDVSVFRFSVPTMLCVPPWNRAVPDPEMLPLELLKVPPLVSKNVAGARTMVPPRLPPEESTMEPALRLSEPMLLKAQPEKVTVTEPVLLKVPLLAKVLLEELPLKKLLPEG